MCAVNWLGGRHVVEMRWVEWIESPPGSSTSSPPKPVKTAVPHTTPSATFVAVRRASACDRESGANELLLFPCRTWGIVRVGTTRAVDVLPADHCLVGVRCCPVLGSSFCTRSVTRTGDKTTHPLWDEFRSRCSRDHALRAWGTHNEK